MHILCQKNIATARRPFSGSSHPPLPPHPSHITPHPTFFIPGLPRCRPNPSRAPSHPYSLCTVPRSHFSPDPQPFLHTDQPVSRLSCNSPYTARHTPPGWPLPPPDARPGVDPPWHEPHTWHGAEPMVWLAFCHREVGPRVALRQRARSLPHPPPS